MTRGHWLAVTAAVAVVLWSLWLMVSDTQPDTRMTPQTACCPMPYKEEP